MVDCEAMCNFGTCQLAMFHYRLNWSTIIR